MAYIGNTLRTAQPNYQIIDDISASFDGSTTTFALQVGGVTPAPFPVNAQHCLISVGGVVQQPDPSGTDGFLLSGSNIVFSAAPSAGENFFGVVLAGADYINVGAEFPDGSVANPSITFDSDRDTGLYRKGANNIAITTNGTERVSVGTSEVVFNDGGEDIDFRIEGDTEPNLFVVNAGDDTLSFGGTITSNLVLANGSGIDFSATADGSGTVTSELLDDYEEGTFTVTYQTDGGTDITMSTINDGVYTKIGRAVFFSFRAASNESPIPAGNIRVAGLPFTVRSSAQNRDGGGAITEIYRWATNFIAANQMVQVSTINGTNLIRLMKQVTSSDPNQDFVDNGDMDTGLNQNILAVTGHYFTDL